MQYSQPLSNADYQIMLAKKIASDTRSREKQLAKAATRSKTARKAIKRKPVATKPKRVTRVPGNAVKRAAKKKTNPVKKLKAKLWELCKQIIRKRYGNTCYTCGAKDLQGSNWHTGHFLPSSTCGNYLRYDLRNLRPQCYRCNISLSGNGSSFYRNLVARDSQAYVDQLFKDKEVIVKADAHFYQNLIDQYEKLI